MHPLIRIRLFQNSFSAINPVWHPIPSPSTPPDPPGKTSPPTPEHLTVKSAGQVCFLKLTEIDWIEAADYYSCLHVGTKSHLLRRSMAELEKELDKSIFCRIHRSTIVKLDRVRGLKLNENGEYDVLLNNGVRLRLSRRYRRELQSRLKIDG